MLLGSAHLLVKPYGTNDGLMPIASTAAQLIGGNPDRICLIVSYQGGSGTAQIAPNANVTITRGIFLNTTNPTIVFTITQQPSLVQSPWFYTAATAGVYFLELFEKVWDASATLDNPDQWNR